MSQFTTETGTIKELLHKIQVGDLGLPEFQRTFKWERSRVRGLVVSILNDYPTGSLLFYSPGDADTFACRPILGAPPLRPSANVTLILDGQQRLTSLYRALRLDDDVRYYVRIDDALADRDPEDYVTYSVPVYRKVPRKPERKYLYHMLLMPDGKFQAIRPPEDEKKLRLLPFHVLCHEGELATIRWLQGFGDISDDKADKLLAIRSRLLNQYKFPIITLGQKVSPDRVAFVFEKINSSGLPLSLFELFSAKLYRRKSETDPGMNLAEKWAAAKKDKEQERLARFDVNELVVLQSLALLKTLKGQSAGCRRKEIFELTLDQVRELWPRAIESINGVLGLMEDMAGIRSSTWFPFPTVTPALASLYDHFHKRTKGKPGYQDWTSKMLRWYWCSVFSNRFTNAVETKLADDTKSVIQWVEKGDAAMPDWMKRFTFSSQSLREARSRSSAIYQGVFCLLLRKAQDFHTGLPLTWERMKNGGAEDHHIFPKAVVGGAYDAKTVNCVLNRTLIDRDTNRNIADKKPSVYVPAMRAAASFDTILGSHLIPVADGGLLSDNFDVFLSQRQKLLAELIQVATGGLVTTPADDDAEPPSDLVPDDEDAPDAEA